MSRNVPPPIPVIVPIAFLSRLAWQRAGITHDDAFARVVGMVGLTVLAGHPCAHGAKDSGSRIPFLVHPVAESHDLRSPIECIVDIRLDPGLGADLPEHLDDRRVRTSM